LANPDKFKQCKRSYESREREKINAYAREWRKKHGHNGTCTICGYEGRLVYDHCHKTGNHRGYICRLCNSGLGMFKDDVTLLRKAADYLDGTASTNSTVRSG
jgi:hypothetical protein